MPLKLIARNQITRFLSQSWRQSLDKATSSDPL